MIGTWVLIEESVFFLPQKTDERVLLLPPGRFREELDGSNLSHFELMKKDFPDVIENCFPSGHCFLASFQSC